MLTDSEITRIVESRGVRVGSIVAACDAVREALRLDHERVAEELRAVDLALGRLRAALQPGYHDPQRHGL